MNVRQLEAFKTIMELGSFTRAAERMNLSQPGISKLIYLLERKCGFSLFHRQKNGVIPTSEGEMLYSEVKHLFLSVKSVESRARAIKELDYGQIQIVSYTSLGTRVLPPILGKFMREHAGLRVSMSVRNSRVLVEAVATQGFDLGFGLFAPDRPGVEFQKLCTMKAVCVMPPGHWLASRNVVHAEDLDGEQFIGMLDEDRAQLKIDDVFDKAGYRRDTVTKVQLTESICAFAAAGVGVSIVDPLCTVGFGASELVVKPFRPAIDFDIWVIRPSFRLPSLATEALIRHVQQGLQAKLSLVASAIGEEK